MMLNQLILARGYVLAPMLPAESKPRVPATSNGWQFGTAFMRMLRNRFGKAPE